MENETEIECPLCMSSLDLDDLSFYPCPCGYQICRFCWHRLYNLEDNLETINESSRGQCPACRREYSETPVYFNSDLTMENIEQMKKQKRKRNKVSTQKQKQLEDKQKLKEILKTQEKNLSGLRVVQKNLLFVIGLPTRLTQEDLRREFIKFGKIHKLVVGNCSSSVNSAYITYTRAEDAVKAILALNNQSSQISRLKDVKNGKNTVLTLKASLGTTKYCTHWLRSQQCPKLPECMYLHELAENEASFTKEEMQKGKHTEYEKKLISKYSSKDDFCNELEDKEKGIDERSTQQQPQNFKSENYQTSSSWVAANAAAEVVVGETASNTDDDKKVNLNTFDEIISSSSDSLSTSYSTCSSGVSVPSPQQIADVECLTRQIENKTTNEINALQDEADLDFDPISVSTNGLQDLINSQNSPTNAEVNNLSHRSLKSPSCNQNADVQQEWRSSLKAIFPNVNITFANANNLSCENINEHESHCESAAQRINATPFVKQFSNQRLAGSSYANYLPLMLQQQQQQRQIPCSEYSWLQQQQNLQRHSMQQFIGGQSAVHRYTSILPQEPAHVSVRRYSSKPVYAPPPPGFSNF